MNLIENIEALCSENEENASKTLEKIKALIDSSKYPDFSKFNSGAHFLYNEIEFIFLGYEQGGALCITANPIGEVAFDEDGKNNWKESSMREMLINGFLPELNRGDLCQYEMDLTADNGDKSYGTSSELVGILSCDLYRKYRDYIPLFKEWMWTCTPWSCNPTHARYVRFVNSGGTLDGGHAGSAYGCVPACIFTIRKS